MHRATPSNTSFRSYSAGGARSVVDKVDDNPMMQEMSGNFMKGESRQEVESPQNYGFSSVVLPAKKGKDGQIEESAEAFISFMGGNRSFPVAGIMDDRRHRPMGLKPGENAQYDDLGQMTLMRRTGLYLMTTDNPDESQQQSGGSGGSTPTLHAGQQQSVERMASLRHVEKKKQDRTPVSATDPQTGQQRSPELIAQLQQQQQQQRQNHKHEGDSVNNEVRCTKKRIEFRSGDKLVGFYDKEKKAWYFLGKVYLGLDEENDPAPLVATVSGPAKQTFAKVP